ncbi:MAG: HAMP domain-containing histidine kinase [Planctomycetota bacterium]|nr:HAMP domain-containing histidine kinase [Planctomycetota bacterium]
MFKRVRQLHISLAAKCQLLFGAAVVLIIAAALFVPWQRMEQLMEQLNERSARTMVDYAVDQHVAAVTRAARDTADATATRPATAPTTQGVYPPTTQPLNDGSDHPPPRLILVNYVSDETLTPFERRALHRLRARPEREFDSRYYTMRDGNYGYRHARVEQSCASCHSGGSLSPTTNPTTLLGIDDYDPDDDFSSSSPAPDDAPAATQPAAQPLMAQAGGLVGIVAVDIPSQIETNQLLLNRVFMLTAGLLAGTLAIIVFYLITTRLILQPVRVLQETAEKVSEGDLNIRSDISTGDEFQQLSETFNTMLSNLKNSADQLRAVNKSLDLKLGQLAESNVALYESNRLKNEFLANVSHELRTPLNSILGFADLLKDASTVTADVKSARYLQNILHSGRHLLELINDLLDLAKIEAGRMDIRPAAISLSDLFEGLISILKPLSETKHLTVVPTISIDVPIIETDPSKLQQVLYNFLSNAIKFSPPNGRIDLAAERVDDGVRIAVTDRGPGIPPDMQAVIFEKFRQLDASVTRQHSGTGLGLAISKELTTLLGGAIGVNSLPGAGSTFWVMLPIAVGGSVQDARGGKLAYA